MNHFNPQFLSFEELGELVNKIYSEQYHNTDNGSHLGNPKWGKASHYKLSDSILIEDRISIIDPKTILDYGCGKSVVVENLQQQFPNIQYTKYDPYINQYNHRPTGQYDFILCNLVIHLLNPDTLAYVIKDIHNLSSGYVFISVAIINNDPNCNVECYINYWQNNFKDFFKIVEKGLVTQLYLTKLTDMCIATFLLKKL